ncbi:hypothetical protein, partial [Streptomyces odontomachi]|uniref:hypothetical protein n=1 Tax=Streptomyces odontomachi TaxID=2944940 RepID=UPI00210DD482
MSGGQFAHGVAGHHISPHPERLHQPVQSHFQREQRRLRETRLIKHARISAGIGVGEHHVLQR